MHETKANAERRTCRAEVVGPPSRVRSARWKLAAVVLVFFAGAAFLWWFDPTRSHVPLCMFHELTGWQCPGCGATRATHELLHGRLLSALHYNALWTCSLPLVLGLITWHAVGINFGRPSRRVRLLQTWAWLALAVAAGLFFVVRNWGLL